MFSEIATTKKIYVDVLILHETKNEIFLTCATDFEMIGYLMIGKMEQKTIFSFEIVDDFEKFFFKYWIWFWRCYF